MSITEPKHLRIEWLPTGALKLDPANPRKHNDRQVKQIARSIQSFGFNVAVLVDREGKVVAGHGRVQAAKQLGLSKIPAVRLDHLTDTQARAFMIADNRLTEKSVWDDALLAETLQTLSHLSLDFDIEATGFTVGEIDLRIESLEGPAGPPEEESDRLPAVAPGEPVSQHGDLWRLGEHRVYCGNALDAVSYRTLMHGKRAAMVFTDPPYNVKIDGHVSGKGHVRHREFAMASGEMSEAEFTGFLTVACTLIARNSAEASVQFICTDWRHIGELLIAGKAAFSELLNLCVWTKHNAGMGSFYRSQHELVFVFKSGPGRHRNNVQLGQFGRNRSNVWSYPGMSSFGRGGEEGDLARLHPTVKPVRLVADAILDCSARGEIVLDPFLGSGTTVIAAERVGRVCYGMEIDPLYVDTIVRRWQAYGGEAAMHAASGKRFDDLADRAEASRGRKR